MSLHKIASRYAKSLITLAQERGILEEVNEDVHYLHSVCMNNRDFLLMLKNPIIHSDKKASIVLSVFVNSIHIITAEFFKIIIRKKREELLFDIAKEFLKQYNVIKGITEATLISAIPLDEEHNQIFKELVLKISNLKADLKNKTDKDIIGGFILNIKDKQLDESISSRIKKIKKEFSENPYLIR